MVGRVPVLAGGCALAGVLAGCSGGGGGETALEVRFVEPASAVDEGGLARIELWLEGEGALGEELLVQLVDAGGGEAEAGADVELGGASAAFPAGSAAGAAAFVEVPALADGLIEALDERLNLRPALAAEGVSAAPGAIHELTIVERESARIEFASAGSSTEDESAGPVAVSVLLALPPGSQLATEVSATVVDSLAGDAQSGVDYEVFEPVTLAFGPADADGSELTVTVMLQGDSEVEGIEHVMLALTAPSARAELGSTSAHELAILDDELAETPTLVVTADDGGGPSELAGGELLDLGAQPAGAGPNEGVLLELANMSLAELTLSIATLSGDTRDFAVELEPEAGGELPLALDFPLRPAGEHALRGVLLELDASRLTALEGRSRVVLKDVPGPGGARLALELERLPTPWSPTGVLRVDGRAVEREALLGSQSAWLGRVLGEPASSAFLAFSPHGSHGWIRRGSGALLHLLSERARPGAPGAPRARMIASELLENQIVRPIALECGGALAPEAPPDEPQALGQGPELGPCRLAIETDYQLFQRFGSVAAATAYVGALVSAVSAQYRLDAQTELVIEHLGLYSTPDDPWTTQDGGGSTIALLYEFQGAWNQDGWPAAADLAHFLSGANLGGGVAWLDVLCNQGYGYAVSANIHGAIDWEEFDGSPTSLSWDYVVFAHELGHNFGSSHSHDYCPPLDVCYSNCEGSEQCSQGTLMSYCHLCGGMANIRLEFHPHSANRIRQRVDASCFGGALLPSGGAARLRLRFEPGVGTGTRQARLRFTHDAENLPSPFELELLGTATD